MKPRFSFGVGVGWKIVMVVLLVVVVTTGFQLWYFPSQQISALTDSLEKKADAEAHVVAYNARQGLEYKDGQAVKEVLDGFTKDADVIYAIVYDPTGARLSAVGLDKAPEALKAAKLTEVPKNPSSLVTQVEAPIPTSTGAKGKLVAGFSRQWIHKRSRQIWRSALFADGIIAMLAVLAGLLLGHGLGYRMKRIAIETEKMAEGDLSRPTLHDQSGDEVGRIARAFDAMVAYQRELVKQISDTVLQLNSSSGEFLATAQQQDRGATEQSSAVEETRRTLESLLDSSREIAKTAQSVLSNAERTQQTAAVMAERIADLSKQVERITEILELIRNIASKSELLALNAALEGTKAGEAGRGFSLVATQMQRLAENVMEAVHDIRDLTTRIREATQSSVLATEESTKLSSDTTRSARQIAMIIQQQQSGTEQVTTAMDDVSQIASQSAMASKQIVSSSTDILHLCERLQGLVERFTLDVSTNGTGAVAANGHDPEALHDGSLDGKANGGQERAQAEADG